MIPETIDEGDSLVVLPTVAGLPICTASRSPHRLLDSEAAMTVSRKHQSRIWRSRLFGVFFFCFVAVFLIGLPVGRTPDYIGKQIEAGEAYQAAVVTATRNEKRA